MVGKKSKTKRKIEREGRYGRYKSRKSYRLVYVKVPGGRTVVQYRKKKPKVGKCACCGAKLSGTLRERPYKMKKLAKSKKRPTRAYSGYYCSKCTRRKIIEEVRE
ncbi:50S ribosomal protein L34e [Candidatus Woesearchaeota archaeon]|nr:50S ribosomal protein L34e [Candidatus Woesearchaeota archaeon]